MRVSWDASEVGDLANELARVPVEVAKRNFITGDKSARRVRDEWRRRATVTAGKHGKLYPKTIKDDRIGALEWKIEPDASMPQGGMNFEYGHPSVIRNPSPTGRGGVLGQPVGQSAPHLDMNITMDTEGPKFVEDVSEDVLPWW